MKYLSVHKLLFAMKKKYTSIGERVDIPMSSNDGFQREIVCRHAQTKTGADILCALDSINCETRMDDVSIVIRSGRPGDGKDIENGYRDIQIVPTCAADLAMFKRRGGMFQIPSESEILEDLERGDRRFIIARDGRGDLCAIMRLGTDTSEYAEMIGLKETLIAYIELIILSPYKHFVYPFLFACFRHLEWAGCTGMVFQIYHLLSWESESKTELLDLENRPSKALHLKLGADKLGALPEKTLDYGAGRLRIRPDTYHIGLRTAAQKLEILCRDSNWRISD